jgi:hypothetical protein
MRSAETRRRVALRRDRSDERAGIGECFLGDGVDERCGDGVRSGSGVDAERSSYGWSGFGE